MLGSNFKIVHHHWLEESTIYAILHCSKAYKAPDLVPVNSFSNDNGPPPCVCIWWELMPQINKIWFSPFHFCHSQNTWFKSSEPILEEVKKNIIVIQNQLIFSPFRIFFIWNVTLIKWWLPIEAAATKCVCYFINWIDLVQKLINSFQILLKWIDFMIDLMAPQLLNYLRAIIRPIMIILWCFEFGWLHCPRFIITHKKLLPLSFNLLRHNLWCQSQLF